MYANDEVIVREECYEEDVTKCKKVFISFVMFAIIACINHGCSYVNIAKRNSYIQIRVHMFYFDFIKINQTLYLLHAKD